MYTYCGVVDRDNCSGEQICLRRVYYLDKGLGEPPHLHEGDAEVDERRGTRSADRQDRTEVLIVADEDRS